MDAGKSWSPIRFAMSSCSTSALRVVAQASETCYESAFTES
jgi:hypothetical protein